MTVFAKQNASSTVGRQLSATRPSFMITDILAAKASGDVVNGRVHVPAGNHNDFDSDEDFGDDADGNSSVCSNGEYNDFFFYFTLVERNIISTNPNKKLSFGWTVSINLS